MGCRTKKQKFHCSTCGKTITRKAKSRISAIRGHYKDQHPRKFKQMTKKAARSRKK